MRALVAALLLALPPGAALPFPAGEPGAVLVGYEGDPAPLLARLAVAGARLRGTLEGARVLVLDAPDAPALRALAAGLPGVRYAELDEAGTFEGTPNDVLYPLQWGLPAVRAPEAWDTVSGGSTIIAVPDTGMFLHPDLLQNLWLNEDEVPYNKVDDDHNGFVDDWRGWDFGSNDSEPMNYPTNAVYNHGTAVAGVAGAVMDNVQGIAGAGQFRLMDLKIIDAAPVPRAAYAALAIEYAVENGARVIVMAWKVGESQALADAIRWAWAQGALLVKSAGNAPDTEVKFPGTLPEVLNVGALAPSGSLASFSVRDPRVELVAPGERVLTTVFPVMLGLLPPLVLDPAAPVPGYAHGNGTSFAAPFVAATAALVWTKNPGLTNQEVRDLLGATAKDLGEPGRDPTYGFGLLDMAAAVHAA